LRQETWYNDKQILLYGKDDPAIRRLYTILVAFLLFLYPLMKLPPIKQWEAMIQLPTLTPSFEWGNPLAALLNPDVFMVLVLLFVSQLLGRRESSKVGHSNLIKILGWSASLVLIGGFLSLFASNLPNVSAAQLVGQASILMLTCTIWRARPCVKEIQLWLRAAVLGTCTVMAIGTYYFIDAFGIPDSIRSLVYAHFSFELFFGSYGRVTYGSIAQTEVLIMLVLPACVYMLASKLICMKVRIFYAVAVLLLLINMGIAFERWAIVTILFLAFLFLVRLYGGNNKVALSFVAIGGIGLGIFLIQLANPDNNFLIEYFGAAIDPSEAASVTDRVAMWGTGIRLIAENPSGVGLGLLNLQTKLPWSAVHNLLLDSGVEGGILAMIGFGIWATWSVIRFFQVLRMSDGEARRLALSLLAGAFCLVVYGIFQNYLLYSYGVGVVMAFWWAFPVLAELALHESQNTPRASLT
jgi:O-antigen ligase